MNNFTCTSSSDDDWTVVAELNQIRSPTPFDIIDPGNVGRTYHGSHGSADAEETIMSLREENRQLTEEWHRLRIDNEGMAREIKGARFLLSKMLETLGLDHDDPAFDMVMSSNVREDLLCFQTLTKKLLHAVESGVVQKVAAPTSTKKPEHGDVSMPVDDAKPTRPTPGRDEQIPISSESTREETERATRSNGNEQVTITVARVSRLPRIEELVEVPREVSPRKTRRMVMQCSRKKRASLKPACLHHVHGASKKKRWSLNRGAPRQAFTARRKC